MPAEPGPATTSMPPVMRLLVTGGAGFIGSNFVRYWVNRHPDDTVVAFDLLTYAGNRPNLVDVEDRIAFVQGDIGDLEGVEKTLTEYEIDVIVNFAAESHTTLAILAPLLPARCPRPPAAGRGGPPARGLPVPPHLDLRGLRRPAPRLRRGVH